MISACSENVVAAAGRSALGLHQPIRLLPHQNRAQVVHGQQQVVGDHLQLRGAGLGLGPVGGGVQIIHGPVDVVDVARRQQRGAVGHPGFDLSQIAL